MAAPIAEFITLKFVKQITVEFCPWERNVRSARQFLTFVGNTNVRKTNLKCAVKTSVKHDGTPPSVLVNYADGQNLLFKTSHLSLSEIVKKFAECNQVRLEEEEQKKS